MVTPQEANAPQEKIGTIALNERTSPLVLHPLAPDEPRAPVSILTLAQRTALVTCLNGGRLYKQQGVWTPACPGNLTSSSACRLASCGRLWRRRWRRRPLASHCLPIRAIEQRANCSSWRY